MAKAWGSQMDNRAEWAQMQEAERAQALWLRVRAGQATAAERAEYDALKAAAYRRMRRDGS